MQDQKLYDLANFWEVTQGGLLFFEQEFGSVLGSATGTKAFKLRAEDSTASCQLSQYKGKYYFIDRGDSRYTKPVNAIDFVMINKATDVIGAIKILFSQFNLSQEQFIQHEPTTEYAKTVTLKKDEFKIIPFKKIEDEAYTRLLFPFYTPAILDYYNFKQIQSYEAYGFVENNQKEYQRKTSATPEFIIYGYVNKDFAKLYQPKAPKGHKSFFKHSFIGKKPARQVYGWDNLIKKSNFAEIKALKENLKDNLGDWLDDGADWSIADSSNKDNTNIFMQIKKLQLESVIIATGGTDGINLASLGYDVIWFNSETERLNSNEYYILSQIATTVYYLGDLDKTGIDMATEIGLKFLKIKIIFLPETIGQTTIKDFADWIRLHKTLDIKVVQAMFKKMLSQSMEFEFWELNQKRNTYAINGLKMLQFLKYNGFFRYEIKNNGADRTRTVEERILVQLKQNIAKTVYNSDVKDFVLKFMRDNYIDLNIQNKVLASSFFNDKNNIGSLELRDLNTKSATKETQLYYFKNKVVSIDKTAIKLVDYKHNNRITWEQNIIQRHFTIQNDYFKIFKNELGEFDIEILNTNCNYLKLLINTSRFFWLKDADIQGNDGNPFGITSKNLTDDENKLQKLSLINKIFIVGHALHKFKIIERPYLILGIDRKVNLDAKDNKGGSGKSAIVKMFFNYCRNYNVINGRTIDKDDAKFQLDGVTSETELNVYEDLSPFYDFNTFFLQVDGDVKANQKGGKIYNILFEDFAKVIVTMNAVPHNISESLSRRMVTFECGDFYHTSSKEHAKARTIADDFGKKTLFGDDYAAADWANDDNFMMQCVKFYLGTDEKIEVSGSNLEKRNAIQQIGPEMMKFFIKVFAEKALDELDEPTIFYKYIDNWFEKSVFYQMYKDEVGQKARTNQKFNEMLILYCTEILNATIELKKKRNSNSNSVEHYKISYIQADNTEVATQQPTTNIETIIEPDDNY